MIRVKAALTVTAVGSGVAAVIVVLQRAAAAMQRPAAAASAASSLQITGDGRCEYKRLKEQHRPPKR